jgi:glycosyltransferase involved in cell wall biosynthesis
LLDVLHPTQNVAISESRAAAPDEIAFRPVVLVPTYNNARTLEDVLRRIDQNGVPVIVVDDGSRDETGALLQTWKDLESGPEHILVTHAINRGKAAALRSGFEEARGQGFSHAVTIDSDGQLAPEEIPKLLEASAREPDAMVLGVRDENEPGYPTKSRLGRRASNLLVRLESGAQVRDSQCGMRVYPLDLIDFVRCRTERYAFETGILTRAAWAGCPFVEVPVTCRYDECERVTHFRPWVDSWRSVAMHLPLTLRALAPWPYRRWKRAPKRERSSASALGTQFLRSLNPAEAYRELRRDTAASSALAFALGIGVFIANLPAYGFQTALAVYVSKRLHLNPLAMILGTQASIPPIGPLLIAAGIAVGHLILHGSLPAMEDLDVRQLGWGGVIGPVLLDWLVGGVVVGTLMGAATALVSWRIFRRVRTEEDLAASESSKT